MRNYIDFLKKDVSYKIEIPFEQGKQFAASGHRLSHLESKDPTAGPYQVFQLKTGQVLFLALSGQPPAATLYRDLKALSSEHSDILHLHYGDSEMASRKFVSGDPLPDYTETRHLVDPEDLPAIIRNHQLVPERSKVYVHQFYGTLYRSSRGYYVLIDEVNQRNGSGSRMSILSAHIFEDHEKVKEAEDRFQQMKKEPLRSEHFYQQFSRRYGKNFPDSADELIATLPQLLNFDPEALRFDSAGMDLVDEAIRWNHHRLEFFDQWYPAVLAYYGKCYRLAKKEGSWVMKKQDGVWVPHFVLSGKEDAFDSIEFYKSLYEWPIPMRQAGDWEGWRRKWRAERQIEEDD